MGTCVSVWAPWRRPKTTSQPGKSGLTSRRRVRLHAATEYDSTSLWLSYRDKPMPWVGSMPIPCCSHAMRWFDPSKDRWTWLVYRICSAKAHALAGCWAGMVSSFCVQLSDTTISGLVSCFACVPINEGALLWQGELVNVHSSLCLTDFYKGTVGTATCSGHLASQQWARQPGGTVTTIQHPETSRCLTMPPMDSSNAGQVFGRILANNSLALVFYNPAPAMQSSTDDKSGRFTSSDNRFQENRTAMVAARGYSVCCDELCWEELSSGVAAMTGTSVSGNFEIEDVRSGAMALWFRPESRSA